VQQRTIVAWQQSRTLNNVAPSIRVDAVSTSEQALASVADEQLLILDTPGHVTERTTGVARCSHLLIQPTSPSADDLPMSVLVFQALERMGIERDKLAFALCRVLSKAEEKLAREQLSGYGYTVLNGAVPEHLIYRQAMKTGRSISETRKRALNGRVQVMLLDLLQRRPPMLTRSPAVKPAGPPDEKLRLMSNPNLWRSRPQRSTRSRRPAHYSRCTENGPLEL
jgi:chromosome partitioning protein